MSAFVVSHDHIDALMTFAELKRMRDRLGYMVNRGREQLSYTQLGQILLAENERSVCQRYPDCTPGNAPGKIGEEAIGYRYRTFQEFFRMQHTTRLVWILKACSCYDYQACETDDYETTVAHHMIDAIRSEAIHSFLEYDKAPWEINRERIQKSA